MSWLATMVVALLTAVAGMLASALAAGLAVDWYRISGLEGGSGYFVVFMALGGFIGGLVIGVVTSRLVAASADPGTVKALGFSLACALGLIGSIAGVARFLADVPPTIAGDTLMLHVEVRWPAEQKVAPTVKEPDEAYLELASVNQFAHRQRLAKPGMLWLDDARQVDGRWVVPGAVEIFTNRGDRVLDIRLSEKEITGFVLRMSGSPRKSDMEWSAWYPREGRGGAPRATGLNYRYRVQPRSVPVRWETFGPFEVGTIVDQFFRTTLNEKWVTSARAEFAIKYRGKPLEASVSLSDSASTPTTVEGALEVAALPGPTFALLTRSRSSGNPSACLLLVDQATRVRVDYVSQCDHSLDAVELTADSARWRRAQMTQVPAGRFDRSTYDVGAMYVLHGAVLDTRHLTVRQTTEHEGNISIASMHPLGLPPDERSFVRFAYAEHSDANPVLLVTDVVADSTYILPIASQRMRFMRSELLDPAWVEHHFEWRRTDGAIDRLSERESFSPLPYRGEVTVDSYHDTSYTLTNAGDSLRHAMVDILVSEFGAQPTGTAADGSSYHLPLRINGQTINLSGGEGYGYVMVAVERKTIEETLDTSIVAKIAARFDALLATGRYDSIYLK